MTRAWGVIYLLAALMATFEVLVILRIGETL